MPRKRRSPLTGPTTSHFRNPPPTRGGSGASPVPPANENLWDQARAAEYVNVSVAWLRESSCPRIEFPPVRGKKGLLRYDPAAVRRWAQQFGM
jgi:hypothetical protein